MSVLSRLAVLVVALAALPVAAQAPRTADLVDWRVRAERAAPGATARLVLDATIAPGWRMYAIGSPVGIPLVLTVGDLPAGVTAGPVGQSETREAHDPVFEQDYPYFAESGRVVQALRVGAGARSGSYEVAGSVRFAICDDRICLPPTTQAFRVPLVVE